MDMKDILAADPFSFLSEPARAFILAFDAAAGRIGYDCGGAIGSGYCWGRYMIIYRRRGGKSRQVAARIYIRDSGIVLRLYLSDVGRHQAYLEQAPDFIKTAFTNNFGRCRHCHNEKDGLCRHRKSYVLAGEAIEKCDGYTFEFTEIDCRVIPDYLELLQLFYPRQRNRQAHGSRATPCDQAE
jgi:hypothetical protein